MSWANRKLKKVLGKDFSMEQIDPDGVRPGGWKAALKPPPEPGKENKHRHVPTVVDDQIVKDISNGKTAGDIQRDYGLRDGYVRDTLIRRFGSLDAMKRALTAQCYENAMALNAHGIAKLDQIAPGQAFVAAKVMVDAGLALEKSKVNVPTTIDFEVLGALGGVIERIEKKIGGTDRTVAPS